MEAKKTKRIHLRGAEPIQNPDGTWTVIDTERDFDIPDLGREPDMCNICGWSTYPECKKTCKKLKQNR